MYLIRFCYDCKPSDRNAVLAAIRKEVEAALTRKLRARLLVPQTRGREAPALEYELELPTLDLLDEFRERAIESNEGATHDWMRDLSELLTAPPTITIYRIDEHSSR